MAQRRMFSLQIVDSDAFLDMPQSTQNLYFHLGMRADDDGFIDKPKTIMRMVGCSEDDYKILLAKRFLLSFESGVVVIKHWKIHNLIQADRYKPTVYTEEMKLLEVKSNKSYTERQNGKCIQSVSIPEAQVRIGKVRKGKESKEKSSPDKPEKHLSYLKNIPEEDLKEFTYRFDASPHQIRSKGEDLFNYCEARGKTNTYKNYKAFLLNALKKDFKEMTDEERNQRARIAATAAKMHEKSQPQPVSKDDVPVNPEAKKKLDEIRGSLSKKMTLSKRV